MTRPFSFLNRVWAASLAILQLVRAWNVGMIMSAVYLGAFLAAGSSLDLTAGYLILCALATGLVAASANVMKDLLDVESDRLNHADRPLVTGHISTQTGLWLAAILFISSIFIAFQLSSIHQALFGLASLLLISYNLWLSRLPLVGNLSIAFVVALSIPFGAIPVGEVGLGALSLGEVAFQLTPTVWIAAVFAFLTTFAREISKDIEDVLGDGARGEHSIPVLLGIQKSSYIVRSITLFIVIFSVLPFLVYSFGGLYLLMMSVTNLFLLLPMSMPYGAGREASITSSTLKWAMMCGMVALAFSESIPLSHTP